MTPQERTLDLPTHRVGLLEWEGPTPQAPLVVALHGYPDTAWTWRRVAPLLVEAGYRVVAPFQRGYAPSAIPADGDYSVRALADDAVALHAALGGDERALLVGHDWGALAATTVASRAAQPYRAIAALAVPPLAHVQPSRDVLGAWSAAMLRQPFRSWYIAVNQVPGLTERVFARMVARLWAWWSPGYDAREDLALLAQAVPDRAHERAVVSYYRAIVPGLREAMGPPQHPLLYLHGARDGCLDPRIVPVVTARMPAGRVHAVPDAGHFLELEQPDAVAGHLLRYWEELP
ncbi:alpha/beta fold hydrolase [Nocardioides sp.]|uniref:alpha/beta fold hydrolase n=1 Tax=Nocardioides sp. TaxID=35761 RepID=UPI00351293BC